MTKEVKLIGIVAILLLLLIVGWIVIPKSPNKDAPANTEVMLSPAPDEKYDYQSMMQANTSDDYTEQSNYTKNHHNKVSSYGNEEERIKDASLHIANYRPNDEQEKYISKIPTKQVRHTERAINEPTSEPSVQHTPSLNANTSRRENLFNDSSSEKSSKSESEPAYINAVIHGEQSVRDGSPIKLRTTEEFNLDGNTIPKNTFIFGQANISEQRLNINIDGFKANGTIFRVSMTVLDQDGSHGLKLISGSGEGVTDKVIEVADYSTSSALNSMPVVGSIAQGTKELFRSKRANNTKPIVLSSNYKVFIKKI